MTTSNLIRDINYWSTINPKVCASNLKSDEVEKLLREAKHDILSLTSELYKLKAAKEAVEIGLDSRAVSTGEDILCVHCSSLLMNNSSRFQLGGNGICPSCEGRL